MEPVYLGDGVYLEPGRFEGELKLYTSNGIQETNVIWMDIHVARSLFYELQTRGYQP